MADELERLLIAAALENPINRALLERLPALNLPDCWLVAGCLFQAVWNKQASRPLETGVKDYDIFYFDDRDLSYDAEDRVIHRVAAALADLGQTIEVKNQARVHLWYRQRFGTDYPQLRSAADGIDRFLISCTCVGIGAGQDNAMQLYAPYGLADLFAGNLRRNPLNAPGAGFLEKAESYRARWPHLRIDREATDT
jgi:uncharacterized protein